MKDRFWSCVQVNGTYKEYGYKQSFEIKKAITIRHKETNHNPKGRVALLASGEDKLAKAFNESSD